MLACWLPNYEQGCVILTVGLSSGSQLLGWLGFNLIISKGENVKRLLKSKQWKER